jgi:arylsulfatase A-like enzyme
MTSIDKRKILIGVLIMGAFLTNFHSLSAQNKPNVVLIFGDNIGIGEVHSYGGVRGVPTPNIDRIGKEGIRLTNFNVEYTCVPSRVSILTGRYAIRTGEDYFSGITLWENTIAEILQTKGYKTALYGKWDVSGDDWHAKREPTQQGFDEWYGIPGTSHVSMYTSMKGFPKDEEVPFVYSGIVGQVSKKVKPFDIAARRTIDRECSEMSVDFIRRNVKQKKPFFLCFPMTQLHYPALPHPDKQGTTRAGDMADAMADIDHNVGLILDELDKSGISNNTIVIWCGDNGAELRRPWRGNPGPWRGYYNSAMEGGVRSPCVIRWPGQFPAGRVSDEIFHETDFFTTFAAIAGITDYGQNDRIIDGVNQLPFLMGKQNTSKRQSCVFLNRKGQVMAVKWQNWKLWYNYKTEIPDSEPDNLVRLFDLNVDPQEEIDVTDEYPWVVGVMDSIVKEYEWSLVKHPLVTASANKKEPYLPPAKGSGKWQSSYARADRNVEYKPKISLDNPDFSGSWSTADLSTVSVINQVEKPKLPSLGSGWGDKLSIMHTKDDLKVEKVFFNPREGLPIITSEYLLNGSPSFNKNYIGRNGDANVSTTHWDGNTLVITTKIPYLDRKENKAKISTVIYSLWLEKPTSAPWEPKLIIETNRLPIDNAIQVVNQTVYSKGYR